MNYLFLIDKHPPTTSANGICAAKIMKELVKRGHRVRCICFNAEDVNGTDYKCYLIPNKRWEKVVERYKNRQSIIHQSVFMVFRVVYWVYRLFMLYSWPMTSHQTARDYYQKACEIVDKESETQVVSISYPGETLLAAKWLKKRYGTKIRTYLFPLDVTTEGKYDGTRLEKYLSRIGGRHFLKRCARNADRLLVLENAEKYFKAVFAEREQSNFVLCGIPLIEEGNCRKSDSPERDVLECVYAGNLLYEIRNPLPLMDELESCKIPGINKINFHLYGRADQTLRQLWNDRYQYINIVDHGWVNEAELDAGLDAADVLINIGNTLCHLIPSKLFKYMSSGKPIVHQYFDKNDPCIPYLMKYKNAYLFFHNKKAEASEPERKLYSFLKEAKSCEVDLVKLFPRCTAGYIADILEH